MQRQSMSKRGHALLISMIFILTASLVMAGISSFSNGSVHMTVRRAEALKAFHVAEGVLQKVHGDLNVLYLNQGGASDEQLAAMTPFSSELSARPEMAQYKVMKEDGAGGLSVQRHSSQLYGPLEGGAYRGLLAQQQDYDIDVAVLHGQDDALAEMQKSRRYAAAAVHERLRAEAIPLAQFFAFYDNDLEILPGPTMVAEGRIHTNKNLYFGSGATLSINAGMTSVGKMYHVRKDGSAMSGGDVLVKNGEGAYVSMNSGGEWLDNNSDNWAQEVIDRYDSLVQSQDHGVPELRLPINFTENPHDVIERRSAGDSAQLAAVKFHNKAGLAIIEGIGYNASGGTVSLTYPNPSNPSQTKSIIATRSWFDYRENRTVRAVEIDVANLIESGKAPANGVLYVSKSGNTNGSNFDAVRLVNGSQLPGQGLTVATDLPLYVKGNYNTVNKTRSLLAADAVNILSNNWSDANTTYSTRVATNTTVNSVVMMGNTETVAPQYNGGLENSLRFSEKWSGKTLTFRGSLINLWNSEIATGNWWYGSPVYEAPNRDWRFDQFYLDPVNSPPGIPSVYAFETVAFAHSY